ncbi:MAG TPA: histone-lysine N-methyltransferase [Syntrophobacteria bacterium]|nr:histone-lysine N-methyltransferase [Syntrophobacteria bacterium]
MNIRSRYEGSIFKLEDVGEPNLFRDIYPYTEVCRTPFDERIIPVSPPEKLYISDTTFRDGQQARSPYTPKQIVDLYKLIHRLGGPEGIIRQSEFFLYSDKDRQAVREVLNLSYRYPEVTGWIRANKDDLQLVKDAELKETGILTSCSDYHIFLKLNKTRKQALEDYLAIVKETLNLGLKPRCHFEDITRADMFGFVVPLARELMILREESRTDIRIRMCDTLGYGVPYSGTALPRSVAKIVRALIDYAGVPGELLEWHGHNDFHKSVANAATAWLHGCSTVSCTLLGFGERTGNTPLEAMIIEYMSLAGQASGIDTTVITDIANYYENELGDRIPANFPLVGSDFNATAAGIHADGLIKNAEIYNIFDTEKLLERPLGIFINDKSGTAGISQWINTHLRLKGDSRIDKRDRGVIGINEWVQEQYNKGRVTIISNKEMEKVVRSYMPHLFVSEFDRIKKRAMEMAERIIRLAAEEPDIKSMSPELVTAILEKLVREYKFIQWAYVTNLEGKMITPIITQPVLKGKYKMAQMPSEFSDRTWFIEPLADGEIHVSKFYVSRVTEILCLTVSAPIFAEADKMVGVLGFDIHFEDLVRAEDML